MTKQTRNGQIEFTGYRSALKHRNALKSLIVNLGGEVMEISNASTGSYYMEAKLNGRYIDVRCSNHTKPNSSNVVIFENNVVLKSTEISILSSEDYKKAVNYIKSI